MSAVATTLTPDQLQAILALLPQAQQANKPAEKPADKPAKSRDKKTPKEEADKPAKSRDKKTSKEQAGKEPVDVSKLDQALAADRDSLVKEGHRLLGSGHTASLLNYAIRVLTWAKSTNKSNTDIENAVRSMGTSIIQLSDGMVCGTGKKVITLRQLLDACRLAMLSTFAPDIGKLGWGIAELFLRFVDGFKPNNPEILKLDDCKLLVARIIRKDAALWSVKGPDRKAIRDAIGDLLGKRSAPAKKDSADSDDADDADTSGVTSIHAVKDWLESACKDDVAKLFGMLSKSAQDTLMDVAAA